MIVIDTIRFSYSRQLSWKAYKQANGLFIINIIEIYTNFIFLSSAFYSSTPEIEAMGSVCSYPEHPYPEYPYLAPPYPYPPTSYLCSKAAPASPPNCCWGPCSKGAWVEDVRVEVCRARSEPDYQRIRYIRYDIQIGQQKRFRLSLVKWGKPQPH